MELRYNVSFDNITLIGSLDFPASQVLQKIDSTFIEKTFLNHQSRFHYNALLVGGGFLQWSHDTDKEKKIRFEFNPNKIRKRFEKYYYDVFRCMTEVHLTRKDIAIDLYDEDLSTGWAFYDTVSRKKIEYWSGAGKIETLYFGAPKTDERIRIYNKALEQGEPDKTWWRVEAQLRGDKANIKGYNPFPTVRIVKKGGYEIYDVRTRAMLYYLENNPGAMGELSQNAKKKYKDLLKANIANESIILPFETEEPETELQSWLNYCQKESRVSLWK